MAEPDSEPDSEPDRDPDRDPAREPGPEPEPDPELPDGVATQVAGLLRRLAERGETLAVAESLTGGLLAATIVGVPGASAVFRGGLVVYATDLKESLAGVPGQLLAASGPVDPDVAIAMAEGARTRCGADWGLAATGVAGPAPQHGVPVGTIYVAGVGPHAAADARGLRQSGDRAAVRHAAVTAALDLLATHLAGSAPSGIP